MEWLTILANISAIATAVIAAGAASWLWLERRSKLKRLESYLKQERDTGADQGQRSVLHLMAKLGMTEAEVLQASFRSKRIRRTTRTDGEGFAGRLLLEYRDRQ